MTHDQASLLLKLAPIELEKLVQQGKIRREGKNDYSAQHLIHDYIDYLLSKIEGQEENPKQAEIAAHLDISDRRVREIATEWSVDSAALSLAEWRVRYIRQLREQAAGRAGAGDLDLVQERAALAREQREGQAIKNAVARKEFAPVGLLADVLGMAASAVVDRFDQLEGALRKACPDLPDEAKTTVQQVIANARNEWLRGTAALVADGLDAMLAGQDEEGDGDDGVVDFEEMEGA